MDLMRAADILIRKIRSDYQADVAVVVVMGSVIYGQTHDRSDLDLYFICNTKRAYDLGMTFIIDGIGFDFWPISWERIQRIADHEEKITSIITEGRVIYVGSPADEERFNALKARALDVSDGKKFLEKAQRVFEQVYQPFFWMEQTEELSQVRRHALAVLSPLTWAVALLNRDTVKRGRRRLKQELLAMALVPVDFERHYNVLFQSSDREELIEACRRLIKNTRELIVQEHARIMAPLDFKEQLNGFYEELINFYNKIYHASETGDEVTALYACFEILQEIDEAFTDTGRSSAALPDLIAAFDPADLSKLSQAAQCHQKEFVRMLGDEDVKIRSFRDLDDLADFYAPSSGEKASPV